MPYQQLNAAERQVIQRAHAAGESFTAIAKTMGVSGSTISREWRCNARAPSDATSWAATLQELRDDPQFARTIAQRARADYEQHYTWNARVSKLLSALRRLEII